MKFTIEGNEQDLQSFVNDKAELMLLRAAIAGDAHRPVNIQRAMQSALNMQSQQALAPAPTQPLVLPSATPPTTYELPAAQYPSPTHYAQPIAQQATAIDVQGLSLPEPTPPNLDEPSPKKPRFQLPKKMTKGLVAAMTIAGATTGIVLWDLARQAGLTEYSIDFPLSFIGGTINREKPPESPTISAEPLNEGDKVGQFTITSGYGDRVHPIHGDVRFHKGVDLDTPIGTPLYSPGASKVECLNNDPQGYGLYAIVELEGSNKSFLLGHLSECFPGKADDGSVIAVTGNTGGSTGPHLHLEEYVGKDLQQPTRGYAEWILSGKMPISAEKNETTAEATPADGSTLSDDDFEQRIRQHLDTPIAQ
jgi:murein DD-endopeptidase MepM/ murein hydrolase activator NlpD